MIEQTKLDLWRRKFDGSNREEYQVIQSLISEVERLNEIVKMMTEAALLYDPEKPKPKSKARKSI